MKFRVRYEHPTDGAGTVTRARDEPMTEIAAVALAEEMCERGEYDTIAVERMVRPGGRWVTHVPAIE